MKGRRIPDGGKIMDLFSWKFKLNCRKGKPTILGKVLNNYHITNLQNHFYN